MNDAPLLHALVATEADDLAVAHEHGTDRNASFAQARPCFVNRRLQKLVDAESLAGAFSLSSV
jgi:hypothetical protein